MMASSGPVLEFASEAWRMEVRPDLGGALTTLTLGGTPILRPTPAATGDVLETAFFPLVPFANRVAGGVFQAGDRTVRLPVLSRFAPHALHGDGWQARWSVEAHTPASVDLALYRPGDADGWPWRYSASLKYALDPRGLTVDLSLTNADRTPMPGGLGLHPYFVRPADARLSFVATGVWLTDATGVPVALTPPGEVVDWSTGPALSGAPAVDHAYAGWGGEARLTGGGRTIVLQADPVARWVQVYAPPGEAFVCVEPVSHRPDALNAPADEASGLTWLAPGETMALRMRISAEAGSP